MVESSFEWDDDKNLANQTKHGVDFYTAQKAFGDSRRVILKDVAHSAEEQRFYCLGEVEGGIMTVRFTMRNPRIRIIGAGYWRKGKKIYEERNQIHG